MPLWVFDKYFSGSSLWMGVRGAIHDGSYNSPVIHHPDRVQGAVGDRRVSFYIFFLSLFVLAQSLSTTA